MSHLILASFQELCAHILGSLCSHFRNICWCLISFYLLLASFQQSMLTFQEHMLVSHLILPPLSLILGSLCSHFRKSVLTFQEHMLVSHLILASFQQSMLTFQELCAHILGSLCSHFRNICWSLISFYLLLASFQQSMLTFQEHMLVSHLILPTVSLILAIYAHFSPFPSHFSWISFLHFFWPNWSCFPLNVFTST